jgi:hypothetical protein
MNNNWLRSISKSYIQLNENEKPQSPVSQRARDYPNENDWGGGPSSGDVLGLNQLNRHMEREGIISYGFILPQHIDTHGSPFNPDGTINSDHRLVQISLETAQRHHGGVEGVKEYFRKVNAQRDGIKIDDPLKKYLEFIKITPRILNGEQKGYIINVMDKPQSSPQPPLNEAR